jgi:hypothetical protein
VLLGLSGDDRLTGQKGNDRLFGAEDNDTLGDIGGEPFHFTQDSGQDGMDGGPGDDTFAAQDGEVDTLNGWTGTDGGTWDDADLRQEIP